MQPQTSETSGIEARETIQDNERADEPQHNGIRREETIG